ncbi:uncharacterized protein LOC121375892 isoform X2 [Gigantopelta aegis]|uniref:uncharacterized protein LOC121375892 isoform X2 n=1 Tax=Gigantopelta aegis TaxID=1735272 RepID=UPI001B8893CD|nr:uncharacterized protein LOC121375892 isoform X2 [Gigantopelta aegis]
MSPGSAVLTSNRSAPLVGLPLVLRYKHTDVTNLTQRVSFFLRSILQGFCEGYTRSNGSCGSERGHNVTRQSGNEVTLVILSFNGSRHAGVWRVQDGTRTFSNALVFTPPFTTVVNTTLIDYTKACPIQEQVDSKTDIELSITTACSYPRVDIIWLFLGKIVDTDTTTNGTDCAAPRVKTTAAVTLGYKQMLGSVHIAVHMKHPSFDNGAFDQLICVPNFRKAIYSSPTLNVKVIVIILGVLICLCIIAVLVLLHFNLKRMKKKQQRKGLILVTRRHN